MNILPVSGCTLNQNENNIIEPIGPKPLESNNSSNEHVPDVIVNNDPQTIYLNNCTLVLSITVTDADEVNGTIGASEPMNGSHIAYVSVDLFAFFSNSTVAMVYNPVASANWGYNTTRYEGIWDYTLNMNTVPPGNYTVFFSAIDNGNSKGAYNLSNNKEYLIIKIGQYNRAPTYFGPSKVTFNLYEDHYNINPYEIDMTTLFYYLDLGYH